MKTVDDVIEFAESLSEPVLYFGELEKSGPFISKRGGSILEGYADLEKSGPFIGKRGGKWADAKHTIAWKDGKSGGTLKEQEKHHSKMRDHHWEASAKARKDHDWGHESPKSRAHSSIGSWHAKMAMVTQTKMKLKDSPDSEHLKGTLEWHQGEADRDLKDAKGHLTPADVKQVAKESAAMEGNYSRKSDFQAKLRDQISRYTDFGYSNDIKIAEASLDLSHKGKHAEAVALSLQSGSLEQAKTKAKKLVDQVKSWADSGIRKSMTDIDDLEAFAKACVEKSYGDKKGKDYPMEKAEDEKETEDEDKDEAEEEEKAELKKAFDEVLDLEKSLVDMKHDASPKIKAPKSKGYGHEHDSKGGVVPAPDIKSETLDPDGDPNGGHDRVTDSNTTVVHNPGGYGNPVDCPPNTQANQSKFKAPSTSTHEGHQHFSSGGGAGIKPSASPKKELLTMGGDPNGGQDMACPEYGEVIKGVHDHNLDILDKMDPNTAALVRMNQGMFEKSLGLPTLPQENLTPDPVVGLEALRDLMKSQSAAFGDNPKVKALYEELEAACEGAVQAAKA